MDSPTKRMLTVEGKEPSSFDGDSVDHSIPADLTLQLRNLGPRVRRSVSQGYVVTPHSFTKAHSTNTIFRSERDTLRDVFASSTSGPAPTIPVANKRGRSMAEEAENEEVDSDEATFNNHSTRLAMDLEGAEHRPVKPLRRNRKTMSDSVLAFGGHGAARPPQMPTAVEAEEEDWSAMMQTEESSSATPFQPLDF
ncbi:hypothetical protein FA13DRAFT_1734093 [Coprinellus micaceus]|uniref:Uncharacterized protein n=1 Tax=Coprinellus micaceus TaxID=71717 RepID=A0A4Y7T7U6_COPMI|nr:hypothetical protein FA13DRAFT_1734093 [Coprinellus micaceus]